MTWTRCALLSLLLLGSATISARRASAQQAFTGHELVLAGSTEVIAGHPMRVRGTAYRVRGLSTLVRHPGAQLRARFARTEERPAEPWVDARADGEGRFEIDVPIPARDHEGALLEVEVSDRGAGDADEARSFTFGLSVRSALDVTFRTDRQLYEPGERIHVWGLLRDTVSLRPLAGETARVILEGPSIGRVERAVTTAEDGVVSFDVPIGDHAPEGAIAVAMEVRGETFSAHTRVGTRTYERIFARVTTEPGTVPPHAPVRVSVEVTTPSGAPVQGANIELTVDGQTVYVGTTESDGFARFSVQAPAYLTHDTGVIGLRAEITHPAHGSAHASGALRLAVPLTLTVEAIPRLGGGLVPEVDDVIYVVLADGAGVAPAAGTEVELEGAAVRGGRARAQTDANGIAEVPARLPPGAWASGGSDDWQTSVMARVSGPLERTARLSLAVQRDAEVAPRVATPVVDPGARIEVDLARGPAARGEALIVELLDGQAVLAVRYVAPSASRTSFDAPADRLGLLSVRARAVHEGELAEGAGAIDVVLVRPARPAFVELRPERTEYVVGERARVSLVATPGDHGFAAVLVRDLAAHAGELAFRRDFMERTFDESVLSPSGPGAERFVRVALAAHGALDAEPARANPLLDALGLPEEESGVDGAQHERGTLRDPFPVARELERRGLGEWMRSIEQSLEEAIANGALDEVATGAGASRRFRGGLLDGEVTLGGGPLEVAHLEAVDPSFRFDNVARRVARARLVKVLVALAHYLDPGDDASVAARMAAREPSERWLPRMIERGLLEPEDLQDPWGHRITLRRTPRPALALSIHATGLELVSPGPDGRVGTGDDVRDPFARAVPAGTPYAVASGEDELMRRLALISPAARTLAAIGEAYVRITAEMTEELIGDAVHAGVSEGVLGLGMSGTGYGGGGSGSGYGRGSGSVGVRMGNVGTIGHGGGSGLAGLARVLRQRFPATLLFRPSMPLDPSGTTVIDIPLADAVTTYVIETIVWRPDGWIWSASTRISVDREVVVDSPIPEIARIGDAIEMPVRVGNRGREARDLVVRVLGDPAVGIPESEPRAVHVAAGDAVVELFTVRPGRVGEGRVRVAVGTPQGLALDAIEQPMRVVERSRRARAHADALVVGRGRISLEIPAAASPRDGELTIASGAALFGTPADATWAAWCAALGGGGAGAGDDTSQASSGARGVASHWANPRVLDHRMQRALRVLTRELDDSTLTDAEPARRLDAQARMLLDLAPLHAGLDRRADLADDVTALIDRLRRGVAEDAAGATDDAEALALGAAALAWTSSERDPHAVELLRRAERSLVSLGEERFVATDGDPLRATILFAMADAALGQRDRALSLVRTLARWASRGGALSPEVRALARVTIERLGGDRTPDAIEVWIDGERRELGLTLGAARIEDARLAAPGAHTVDVALGGDALVLVRASATYGLPWETSEVRGPFALSLEGEVGALDGTATLELVVRNRTPRTIAAPVLEIDLPTGAEIPEASRRLIGSGARRPPDRAGDVLTVELPAMLPGARRRVALPLRWSVGGTLPGLGVVAYATDRPEAQSVLPPREIRIEGGDR